MSRKLNYSKAPVDLRDFVINITPSGEPGNSVDLSSNCTSVKDQGRLGTASVHAAIGCLEYIHKKFGGQEGDDIFSERFTYYVTRNMIAADNPTSDGGAYLRDVLKSLVRYGSCKEDNFPYVDTGNSSDYNEPPPPICYTEANKFQALKYAKFPDVPSILERTNMLTLIKKHLSHEIPIICGINCTDATIVESKDGILPTPILTDPIIGGHAILIIGYNDTSRLFKFKNSWGTSWGDNGYGYISYDYYIYNNMYDLWSLYTVEDLNREIGLNIIQPPPLVKSATKKKLCCILRHIAEHIDVACHPQRSAILFSSLRAQHGGEPCGALIMTLKAQFKNIADNPV